MKVRLTKRWGARLPGAIISVSDARARYLANEIKVGRIIDEPVKKPTVAEAKSADESKKDDDSKKKAKAKDK